MATRYRFGDCERAHFVTFSVVEWIDVFSREDYKQILVDSLRYSIENKGLIVHAWVIMPNHVHLVISAQPGNDLSGIMRDVKKFTSRMIIKAIEESSKESRKHWMLWLFKSAAAKNSNNNENQFWQQDNHPIELRIKEMMDQRLDYLHNNPVKAGLVWEPADYKYSSAIDYYRQENGLLPVVLLV
ncbi:REP-associated tyrosine transposase [Mucilaginibacter ginsenosidivorans]|uniref:Transposase n=1 Tax=Mucilaginibacter ginsenosidivorans TaxID=398053 RepID=A0A5B8UX38_9SPHI|nr:transposase [Mucilaginibacter ginsenosidivorans]QEC63727.1 transposase [Mucilaginibacter ginsenosidivorans]